MTGSSDLVVAAQNGDPEAFRRLIEQEAQWAYGVAVAVCGSSSEAEDVLQEAILRAWRDMRTLRDPGMWRAWFRQIATRAAIDMANKSRGKAVFPWGRSEHVPDIAERIDESDRVRRAMARLGPADRALIALRYGRDLELPAVASLLEIPLGTAKSRQHRATRETARDFGGHLMDLEQELRNTLKPILSAEPPFSVIQRATQDLRPPNRAFKPWLTGAATAGAALVIVVALALSWPSSSGPPGTSVASADTVASTASGDPSPDATPDASVAPSPASPESTVRPTSPVADPPLSDLERSDEFWAMLLPGESPEEVYSLEEAIEGADLVALGRFAGFEDGEVGGYAVTRFTILIDEIMKGEPQSQVPGTIRLQTLPVTQSEIEGLLPNEQTLFFLWYVPDYLERHGQPEEEQQAELYDYIVLDWSQGVMRDIDGRVATLEPTNPRFPAMFEGQPFDEIVDSVRELSPSIQ